MWMTNLSEKIPQCPICRRVVPVQVSYNFSHPMIRLMRFLYVLEIFLYYTNITPILQGTAILAFPFALPCSKDFLFFATHYSIHSILDMFLISERELLFFRYIHLILLTMYINHKKIHPLTHFVEGRSLIHAKSIEYSESALTAFGAALTATQPATNALEGNKPRRSGRRKG
jgi:hypothetical protein